MKKQPLESFVDSKLNSLHPIKGGIWVYCKDAQGNTLGSYETDCDDETYWITDCKGIWENSVMAAGGPG